jgi:hypothetical protein
MGLEAVASDLDAAAVKAKEISGHLRRALEKFD